MAIKRVHACVLYTNAFKCKLNHYCTKRTPAVLSNGKGSSHPCRVPLNSALNESKGNMEVEMICKIKPIIFFCYLR